ncbi:hypothetical protein [Altererythrobacter fulvus]|uniref:hypothetical protein n=1 Tax=Caenibius fulvus TaxID=2126012 RepID=UPI00301644FA
MVTDAYQGVFNNRDMSAEQFLSGVIVPLHRKYADQMPGFTGLNPNASAWDPLLNAMKSNLTDDGRIVGNREINFVYEVRATIKQRAIGEFYTNENTAFAAGVVTEVTGAELFESDGHIARIREENTDFAAGEWAGFVISIGDPRSLAKHGLREGVEGLGEAGIRNSDDAVEAIARHTDDFAEIFYRKLDEFMVAEGDDAARLADELASMSMHGSGDRLVLGRHPGYIQEAMQNGGVWYETPNDFFRRLEAYGGWISQMPRPGKSMNRFCVNKCGEASLELILHQRVWSMQQEI